MSVPEMWPAQREAVSFCLERPAAMLDMGMGCGKTRVAVEAIRRREDKPRETEEKPKPSPLDDYKFHVDTGGAIVCSNDAYELLDALRDMHWL